MAGAPQPLAQQYPIVGPDGRPTEYFIRWAQERQIDIKDGITAEQALEIIEDWSASRNINAGNALSGGGPLSSDVTINYDGGIADQKDVDLSTPQTDQQVLVWDAASSKWVPADQTGSGGGWEPWVVSEVGTGVSQVVSLPVSVSSKEEILVFVNGIRYETTEYTVSGSTVTLTTNASGDSIQITGVQPSSGSGSIVSAYVNFVPGSPPTVDSSSGIASVVRTNTGRYRITFSSAFANAYYGMAASGRFVTGAGDNVPSIGVDRRSGFGKTTTTIDITCTDQSGNPSDNLSFVNICFFAV